jgi:uncharacterized membrane protein
MPQSGKGLSLRDAASWLQQGVDQFRQSWAASIAYAALFVLPGLAAEHWLADRGYWAFFFILCGGFMLLAPVLLAGYYPLSQQLRQQETITLPSVPRSFARLPLVIWVIGILQLVLFLVWVTDALMIYGVYFDFSPYPQFLTDPAIQAARQDFLLYITLLGMVLAFATFIITALSTPHIVVAGAGVVAAISFSVRQIAGNLLLMSLWALALGAVLFATLLFAMPLALLLMPVLSYANMACYREIAARAAAA